MPPPVLHDWAGWSPYQQHTSVARVIESPIAAMLVGSGGAAVAEGAATAAAMKRIGRSARRPIGVFLPRSWRIVNVLSPQASEAARPLRAAPAGPAR